MRSWKGIHTLGLGFFVVLIFVLGLFLPGWLTSLFANHYLVVTWFVVIALLSIVLLVVSHGTTGRVVKGVLVDTRNQMSLSRFQLAAWTILIVSAFLTLGLFRVAKSSELQQPVTPTKTTPASGESTTKEEKTKGEGVEGSAPPANTESTSNESKTQQEKTKVENATRGAFDLNIPAEVWGLLGISAGSLVGAAGIKGIKSEQTIEDAKAQEKIQTLEHKRGEEGTLINQGTLVANKDADNASVADLFQGDELGDALTLDIGKVQLFLFTLVAFVGYGIAIYALFSTVGTSPTASTIPYGLPEISAGILVLLGISHAGYLGNKYLPSTDTNQGAANQGAANQGAANQGAANQGGANQGGANPRS